jgi:DNA-binding CsgD family transcriptional regulator
MTTDLTPRQIECLRLAAIGYTNTGIAHQLGMTRNTVRTHLQAVRDAIGARNTTHAVAIGAVTGLITADHLHQ